LTLSASENSGAKRAEMNRLKNGVTGRSIQASLTVLNQVRPDAMGSSRGADSAKQAVPGSPILLASFPKFATKLKILRRFSNSKSIFHYGAPQKLCKNPFHKAIPWVLLTPIHSNRARKAVLGSPIVLASFPKFATKLMTLRPLMFSHFNSILHYGAPHKLCKNSFQRAISWVLLMLILLLVLKANTLRMMANPSL